MGNGGRRACRMEGWAWLVGWWAGVACTDQCNRQDLFPFLTFSSAPTHPPETRDPAHMLITHSLTLILKPACRYRHRKRDAELYIQ